jgi:hypothetical protein
VHTGFWWGNLRKRDRLEDLGVDGRIISKWIFTKWDGGIVWIDLAQDRDRWGGCCESGNKPSFSVRCREFLD